MSILYAFCTHENDIAVQNVFSYFINLYFFIKNAFNLASLMTNAVIVTREGYLVTFHKIKRHKLTRT